MKKDVLEVIESSGENRREYRRIKDWVRLEYRLIPPGQMEEVKNRSYYQSRKNTEYQRCWERSGSEFWEKGLGERENGENLPVSEALVRIDQKLTHILDLLQAEKGLERMQGTPQSVELSASGVRFTAAEAFENGNYLEVKIALPTFPEFVLLLVSEVVWTAESRNSSGGRFQVGVRFIEISDEDREYLCRYVLRREQSQIRARDINGSLQSSNDLSLPVEKA